MQSSMKSSTWALKCRNLAQEIDHTNSSKWTKLFGFLTSKIVARLVLATHARANHHLSLDDKNLVLEVTWKLLVFEVTWKLLVLEVTWKLLVFEVTWKLLVLEVTWKLLVWIESKMSPVSCLRSRKKGSKLPFL